MLTPDSIQSLMALAIGFATAGLLASAYQLLAQRPLGFGALHLSPQGAALATVPVLVFAAPFVIMRNSLRGEQTPGRRFQLVMLATVVAGFWSLMSGTVVVLILQVCGVL